MHDLASLYGHMRRPFMVQHIVDEGSPNTIRLLSLVRPACAVMSERGWQHVVRGALRSWSVVLDTRRTQRTHMT